MSSVVGIVGGGPSGTRALARLAAHLRDRPSVGRVEIHLFNRSERFGCGDVYDPRQLESLLINVSAGDFRIWSTDGPPPVVPEPLALDVWCRRNHQSLPDGRPVQPESHPPRATAGRYLMAAFEALAAHLPDGVTLHLHVGDVFDVAPVEDRLEVTCSTPEPERAAVRIRCDHVLLTTGHTRRKLRADETSWRTFAEGRSSGSRSSSSSCLFLPDVYPTSRLDAITPGSTVAMRGLSLTFVDAVLALTEGRGGTFERLDSGPMVYRPGGDEPLRILPFSRTGLPAPPRSSDITHFEHEPAFFRPDIVATLPRDADGKLDVEQDLWPLFELEMKLAFYRVKTRGTPWANTLETDAPPSGDEAQALEERLETFHRRAPAQTRFDANKLLRPFAEASFPDGPACHHYVLDHLQREHQKARRGAALDAEKCAVEMWRFCRPLFLNVASYGGLNPGSHRRFHEHLQPRLQHLVFGPPAANVEKIIALANYGLVDFSIALGPRVETCDETGTFRLQCRRSRTEVLANVLADARVAPFSLLDDASRLYLNLQRRELVRLYNNKSRGETPYAPGALDLEPRTARVLTARGSAHPNLCVVGAPAHGCHYENTSPLVGDKGQSAEHWAAAVAEALGRA